MNKFVGVISFAAVCVAAYASFAAKQDGVWIEPISADRTYSSTSFWLCGKHAKEGGKATFINQGANTKNFNIDSAGGVTWGGIDLGDSAFTMTGNALTLSGTGDICSDANANVKFSNPVVLAAGAKISQRGRLSLEFPNTVSMSADSVYSVVNGKLTSTAATGFHTAGTLDLQSGLFVWKPTATAGDALVVNAGKLKYGPDRAHIRVEKGNAASYAVTFSELTRTNGGFLDLQLTGDISALGNTEKFLVKDRASDAATFIDASVISRGNGAEGNAVNFLRYDATRGFIPAETKVFESGSSTLDGKVAVISANTTISENTTVSALLVTDGALITIASGVTLTIGDGVHPAGVVFHGTGLKKRSASSDEYLWSGPGKLQFAAGARGYFYFNGNVSGATTSWTQECCHRWCGDSEKVLVVSGNSGVTLAGVANSINDYGTIGINSTKCLGWTGGTTVIGVRIQSGNSVLHKLPGPVGVYGDWQTGFGAELRQNNSLTFDEEHEIGGVGPSYSDNSHCGVFDWGGEPGITFSKTLKLVSDTFIRHDNACATAGKANVVAKGGVTGPYGFTLGGNSKIDLAGKSDYTGKTVLNAQSSGLYITGPNGTPGAGKVVSTVSAKPAVTFRLIDGLITSNDYKSIGPIVFDRVTNIAFKGEVSFASALFSNDVKQVTACGSNSVNFGSFYVNRQVAFSAAEDGGSLQLGKAGTDFSVGAEFKDGTNSKKFGLDKVTSDTVTLEGAVATHSGPTRILEGTLKLKDDILTSPDILYWMDAADETSFTKDGDQVIRWNSKVGAAGLAFVPAQFGSTMCPGPMATNTCNSKRVFSFSQSEKTCLVLTNAVSGGAKPVVDQRTVFLVARPQCTAMDISNCGIFGALGKDVGQRVGKNGWNLGGYKGDKTKTAATFDTTDGLRIDGVQRNTDNSYLIYRDNEMQVLSMRHELDYSLTVDNYTYNSISKFTPSVGNYHSLVRAYSGEIAEVIAFSRLLTTNEMERVENYLADKWGIAEAKHSTLTPQTPLLSPNSPLEIAKGAVLDLNGVSATVAALSGAGTIINSSVTAATLTVSGANTFQGEVTGTVTLKVAGENNPDAGYTLRNGASLEIAGVVALGYSGDLPVTNGVAYWLDASHTETVFTDDAGHVTNWNCRLGKGVTGFYAKPEVTGGQKINYTAPERYDLTGFDGKPGVYFGNLVDSNNVGSNQLISAGTAATKTLFLACKCDATCASTAGFWGSRAGECGIIIGNSLTAKSNEFTLRFYTGTCYHRYGYLLHALGKDTAGNDVFSDYTWNLSTDSTPIKRTFVLAAQLDESNASFTSYDSPSSGFVLGRAYHMGVKAWYGEVIAYDRILSAREVADVEQYLKAKWLNSNPVAALKPTLAENTAVKVTSGATLDLNGQAATLKGLSSSGGTLKGDVTLSDSFAFDFKGAATVTPLSIIGSLTLADGTDVNFSNYSNLKIGAGAHSYLNATGEVSGDFDGDNLEGTKFRRVKSAKTFQLLSGRGGVLLLW